MKEYNKKVIERMFIEKYRPGIEEVIAKVPEEFEDFVINYGSKLCNQFTQVERAFVLSCFVGDLMSSLDKFCNRTQK
jgi:hypothetical protein